MLSNIKSAVVWKKHFLVKQHKFWRSEKMQVLTYMMFYQSIYDIHLNIGTTWLSGLLYQSRIANSASPGVHCWAWQLQKKFEAQNCGVRAITILPSTWGMDSSVFHWMTFRCCKVSKTKCVKHTFPKGIFFLGGHKFQNNWKNDVFLVQNWLIFFPFTGSSSNPATYKEVGCPEKKIWRQQGQNSKPKPTISFLLGQPTKTWSNKWVFNRCKPTHTNMWNQRFELGNTVPCPARPRCPPRPSWRVPWPQQTRRWTAIRVAERKRSDGLEGAGRWNIGQLHWTNCEKWMVLNRRVIWIWVWIWDSFDWLCDLHHFWCTDLTNWFCFKFMFQLWTKTWKTVAGSTSTFIFVSRTLAVCFIRGGHLYFSNGCAITNWQAAGLRLM